jgi:uncharacterized protein YjiS (DUF1127 family)
MREPVRSTSVAGETVGIGRPARLRLLHGSIPVLVIVRPQHSANSVADKTRGCIAAGSNEQERREQMAFLTGIGAGTAVGLSDRLERFRDAVRATRRVRAVYRQTYDELARLSDRDLADLGLHRSQIPVVARQAADMVRA